MAPSARPTASVSATTREAARAATATWDGAETPAPRVRHQRLHRSPPRSKLRDLGIPFCLFSVVQVKFPKFYGYSHMTLEPLKNSYQTSQITVEFKVGLPHPFVGRNKGFVVFLKKKCLSSVQAENEDGLLLYCGENEHGRGDFTSLALVRGKLHYR